MGVTQPKKEPEGFKELLARYLQAWTDHDPDAIVSMMTPDATYEASTGPEPWGARYVGREAIRKAILDGMATAEEPNTDYRHSPPYIVGDHAFAEWTSAFTRKTGERVCVHGCDLFEYRDGLIHRKIAYRKSSVAGYMVVRKD